MLTPLLDKGFDEIETLSLHTNPELWVPESDCIDLIKSILALQNGLQSLNLAYCSFYPYYCLREANLPQAVIDLLEPSAYENHCQQVSENLKKFSPEELLEMKNS